MGNSILAHGVRHLLTDSGSDSLSSATYEGQTDREAHDPTPTTAPHHARSRMSHTRA
jgi:hypothetical protein